MQSLDRWLVYSVKKSAASALIFPLPFAIGKIKHVNIPVTRKKEINFGLSGHFGR